MAAGRLDVLLGLNAAEFTKGLSKAELDAKKFQADLVRLGSQIGTAIGVGAASAAAALAYMTKSSIDAADHLNDLSKATGVTVENLGGIGFAASQAGADLDGVAASFGKLNIKIAEAARGEKEAAEAFRAIGVAVKDAAGNTRAADAVFKDVATAFAGFADGPEKAALGMAIFGKSYQAMLPLLADGGKALQENIDYYKQFGGVTTETAQQADAFNDTLGKIELIAGQLGRNLARELLPALQAVADELLRTSEQSGAFDFIAKGARVAFETVAILFANVKFVFEGVGREIAAVAAQMTALSTLDFAAFDAISQAVKEDGERARKELDALEKRILQVAAKESLASKIGTANPDRALERATRGPLPNAPVLGGPATKKAKEQIDENAQSYARYVDQLAQGLEKEQELSKVQEVTRAIEQNRFGTLIPQQKELLLLLAAQADAADEYAAKIKHNAELEREQMRAMQERADLIDTKTGRKAAREAEKEVQIFGEEFKQGNINFVEYMVATHDYFNSTTKEIEKTNDAAEQLGLTFASAIGEFIKDPSGGAKGFFDALGDDLMQLLTQMLIVQPVAELLKKTLNDITTSGGSGGGGGDFWGSIAGAVAGAVASSATGSDYVAHSGLRYVHAGEKIITAEDNRRGNFGASNNVFNISGPVTRDTLTQIQAAAARGQRMASMRNN